MGNCSVHIPARYHRNHRRLVYLLYFVLVTVCLRVWILIISVNNIYYDIAATIVTLIMFVVLLMRAWREYGREPAEGNANNLVLLRHTGDNGGLTMDTIDALPKSICVGGKLVRQPPLPDAIDRLDRLEDGIYQDMEQNEEQSTCAICLAEFSDHDILVDLPCGHHYHEECIRGWLVRKAQCPLCKAVIRPLDEPAIYTNEDNTFFVHNNIVYNTTEGIVVNRPPSPSHHQHPAAAPPSASGTAEDAGTAADDIGVQLSAAV